MQTLCQQNGHSLWGLITENVDRFAEELKVEGVVTLPLAPPLARLQTEGCKESCVLVKLNTLSKKEILLYQ